MTIKKDSAKSSQQHASYAVANNPTLENRPMKSPKLTDDPQPFISPYTISINFHCGCGFVTHVLTEAVKHALENKHSLEVSGWIRYLRHVAVSKVEAVKKSQAKFSKYDSDIGELHKAAVSSSFDEMKAKLLQIRQT